MKMYSIHKDYCILLLKETILPFLSDRENSIRHVGYHFCRSVYTVNRFPMGRDIAGSHIFSIHGLHLILNV